MKPIVFGNHQFRKEMARRVRKGIANLVVIGNTGKGFYLAIERGKSLALVIGQRFTRQKHAVGVGINRFEQNPVILRGKQVIAA